MRGLRGRTVVVVVLAALAPALAIGVWARGTLLERAGEELDRALAAAVIDTQQDVARDLAVQTRAVARLCELDFVVDRLVLDLAADRFDASAQDDLVRLLPGMMHSLDLDVLEILDAGGFGRTPGVVLGSSHYSGRSGSRDPSLLLAAEHAQERSFVADVRVRAERSVRTQTALLTGCVVDRHDVKLRVIGGRFLAGWTTDVGAANPARVGIRLRTEPGELASGDRLVYEFRDADGNVAAELIARIDDGPMRRQIAELDRGLLIAGVLSLLVAIGVGAGLAWSATRPLSRLEDAARRVAAGDLDVTFGVSTDTEVGRALAAFDHMTRELKTTRAKLLRAERVAAWREIARRIAHEIKNPLSPIQLSIETMRRTHAKGHPDFEEIFEESTSTVLEEVERLKHIVSEFSQFARLPRPQLGEVDLGDIVDHVLSLHLGSTVKLQWERPSQATIVRADREQITQVLVNLVQNAIDAARARHGDSGGWVCVTMEQDDGRACVWVLVRDNGVGIPPEDLDRVFDPYFTTKSGGTGLGLAIVHRIVDEHGGEIVAQSPPEGGARLTLLLTRSGPKVDTTATQSRDTLP